MPEPSHQGEKMRPAVVLSLLSATSISCQQPDGSKQILESLVQTERAFASTSVTNGARAAFLEFLAEDGILFNTGPVSGVAWWKAQPESEAVLSWGPEIADVSAAGDMGYTSGPWILRQTAESPPSAWGHFVTVWKKTSGGSWKLAADGGITHEAVELPGDDPVVRPSESFLSADRPKTGDALERVDREYSVSVQERGFLASLDSFVAPYGRFYRDGALPIVGIESITGSDLVATNLWANWEQHGAQASTSADLGFTYGVAEPSVEHSQSTPSVSYLRIWQRGKVDGSWRVVVDLLIPIPPSPEAETAP